MADPRAEWYQDPDFPDDPLRVRYWDGAAWTEHRHVMQPAEPPLQQPPAQAEPELSGLVMAITSHEEGRNATVYLFKDRIERIQLKKRTSLSSARQSAEVTPMRAVTSVQTQKDGIRYTKVIVYASANATTFRLGHDDAERFRAAIISLIL